MIEPAILEQVFSRAHSFDRYLASDPARAGSGRSGSMGAYQLAFRTSGGPPPAAGTVRLLGFRDEPAAVSPALFAALGADPAALPAAGRGAARKR